MLEPTKANIDVVADGVQAVEAAKSKQYDVILMDIQMPEMDGIAAFKAIRDFEENLPIVALTANVMSEDVQHYSELGFNAHIGKPIDMNLLYSTLNHFVLLRKRSA